MIVDAMANQSRTQLGFEARIGSVGYPLNQVNGSLTKCRVITGSA